MLDRAGLVTRDRDAFLLLTAFYFPPDFGDTCDATDGFSCVAVTRRLFKNQLSDWGQDRVINVVSAGRTRGPDLT